MSCRICEEEPIITYMRIGNGNVEVRGCEEHLRELIRVYRKGSEEEIAKERSKE